MKYAQITSDLGSFLSSLIGLLLRFVSFTGAGLARGGGEGSRTGGLLLLQIQFKKYLKD